MDAGRDGRPIMNVEEARSAWLRCGIGEVDAWCRHIAMKTRFVIGEQMGLRAVVFEEVEVLADSCIVIERLAHIKERTGGHIGQMTIAKHIADVADWPEHVALAFWSRIRNPTMHIGRVNSFSEMPRKHEGISLFADVHPNWAWRGPCHPYSSVGDPGDKFECQGRGWWSLRGSGLGATPSWRVDSVTVTFWVSAIFDLLTRLRADAIRELQEADHDQLRQLDSLNAEMPFMFCGDDPPETLPELDLSDVMYG